MKQSKQHIENERTQSIIGTREYYPNDDERTSQPVKQIETKKNMGEKAKIMTTSKFKEERKKTQNNRYIYNQIRHSRYDNGNNNHNRTFLN